MLTSPFFNIDAISWYHIDVGYIIGDQIARKKVRIKSDRGVPKLFQEIVQYWVAFDLVKILHRYGLKPAFNESLREWSPELYSLVMVLSKTETTTEEKEQAERCLSTLFDVTIIQSTMDLSHGLNLVQNTTSKKCLICNTACYSDVE